MSELTELQDERNHYRAALEAIAASGSLADARDIAGRALE